MGGPPEGVNWDDYKVEVSEEVTPTDDNTSSEKSEDKEEN